VLQPRIAYQGEDDMRYNIKEEPEFVAEMNQEDVIGYFRFKKQQWVVYDPENWNKLMNELATTHNVRHDGVPDKWPVTVTIHCGAVRCGEKICTVVSEGMDVTALPDFDIHLPEAERVARRVMKEQAALLAK